MSDALIEVLSAHRKRLREDWLKEGKNEIPEWVFPNQERNRLSFRVPIVKAVNRLPGLRVSTAAANGRALDDPPRGLYVEFGDCQIIFDRGANPII